MTNSSYQDAIPEFDKGLCGTASVLKVIVRQQGISSELIPMIATGPCSLSVRDNLLQ
jgi:hypothetical protein